MLAVLIKASVVIIVLLTFYKIFLEKETFFAANRIYLLGCLILAGTLPFITLPKLIEHQGIVNKLSDLSQERISSNFDDDLSYLDKETSKQRRSSPLEKSGHQSPTNSVDRNFLSPKSNTQLENQASENLTAIGHQTERDFTHWLIRIYLFGVAILSINLLVQVVLTLLKIRKNMDRIEDEGVILVNLKGNTEPCSFFNYIFINPTIYDYETYQQIIAHEKIHVKLWHTIDLLMSELAVVALWFNPFIWILRREVEKNIEFQTDDLMINENVEVKESYQLSLVKIGSHTQPLTITTNYNQSLLKQRIIKMNAKKSNIHSYWKYSFIPPILFMLSLFLNQPRNVNAQNSTVLTLPVADDAAAKVEKSKKEGEPAKYRSDDASDCKKLSEAIHEQNVTKIKELLKTADPNCIEPNARHVGFNRDHYIKVAHTPLSAAAKTGNLEIGALLLEAGSKIDFQDTYLKSPLMAASIEGQLDFAKFLVEQGANINLISANHGSALHCAARGGSLATANFLLEQGASINAPNEVHGTPLSSAARFGHSETVTFLIDKGAIINANDDTQLSALNAAAGRGHIRIMELLLAQGANIDFHKDGKWSALYRAAWFGKYEAVEFLLKKGASINLHNGDRGTALVAASFNGNTEIAKLLLSKGAGIDLQNDEYGTALIIASSRGHIETVQLLLSKGAKIDLQVNGQGSTLQAPANKVHRSLSSMLSNKDLQSGEKMTALIAAARKGHLETVKLLLAEGANIDLQSDEQSPALHAAARNGRYKIVELLPSKGADIHAQHIDQGSALHAAVRNGHLKTVELLLTKGADIHHQNDTHGSAFNVAARSGHNSILELLLSQGADINEETARHGSALHAAARNGHLETVKFLVANGADVNLHCKGEGTPLDAAVRNAHRHVVKYLESKQANNFKED